jgi:hypothetical protein
MGCRSALGRSQAAGNPLGGWLRYAAAGGSSHPATTRTGVRCGSGSESKRSVPV